MKVFFCCLLLFLFSCSSRDKIPSDVLSQSQMQAVLWDMLRTDEFISIYERRDTVRTLKEKSVPLYEEVFRIHKTSKAQLQKSIDFYTLHPDLFKTIIDSLEKRKSVILSDTHKKYMKPDSLKSKIKHIPVRK